MAESRDRVQQLLGPRYRIERVVGEGGAAVVYAAADTVRGRRVALKILREELANEVWATRFVREIQITSSLSHPGIVPLLESGEVEGRPFAVMPLVDGETLRTRLEREVQFRLADVLEIVDDVAEALDHAHAAGIVHRDIKPENVLLTRERAMVLDFGIARAIDAAGVDRLTQSGIAVGTPHYMSPEQADADRQIDGRSDVYALACITYEMLAGQPPFSAATSQALRSRHALEAAPSVRIVRPTVPEGVDGALRDGLAKVPADRPPTAGEFAARLRAGAALPRRRRRSKRVVAASLLAVAVLVAGTVVAVRGNASNERTWVLIANIEAPPGQAALGAVVADVAATVINESRLLAVVPAEQIRAALKGAGLPDSTTLDATRASEIAERSAVKAVITGAVRDAGNQTLSVTLQLLTADSGRVIVSRSGTASLDGDALVREAGRLAADIRRALGDRPALFARTRPVENIRTPSLAAYRLYSDALATQRLGNFDASIHLLRQAVRADSAFAAGWAALAMMYVAARQPDSAQAAFGHALAHPERLSEPELDRLRGDAAYHIDHDVVSAVRWYQRFLEQRPQSVGAINNLGLYLSALGRHAEALDAFERAMLIDPLAVGARAPEQLNTAAELVVVGRIDSAQAIAAKLSGAGAQYMRLMLLNAADDWSRLADEAEKIADDPLTERFVRIVAQVHAAGARAALGDDDRAAARLEHAATTAHGAEARCYVHARIFLDLTRGVAPGWVLPGEVAADTSVGADYVRGLYAAARHDTGTARRALRAMSARGPRAARTIGEAGSLLTALIAVEGRDRRVTDDIVRVARAGENDPFNLDRPSSIVLRWVAGELLDLGQASELAREMRTLMRRPTGLPPAHYGLRGFVAGPRSPGRGDSK